MNDTISVGIDRQSVGRRKLLEDPFPLAGIALAVSGAVDDNSVGVDCYLGGLAGDIEVTDHLSTWRRHFSGMIAARLGCRKDVQPLIERDGVEVNLILESGIDGANAPQRGATVRSPRGVEEYEDRFPVGNEFGGVDHSVARERQHIVGGAVADSVSDVYGLL